MNLLLPPYRAYRRQAFRANGWTDQYGALQTAAAYAGTSVSARRFNAVWQHGCFGPWVEYSPELLTYSTPNARALPVFVAREEQAELLRRNGFGQAEAIGLPIVYAAEDPVQRWSRSLLVVPTHTLSGAGGIDRGLCERYAEEIDGARQAFDHVAVCIHPHCRKNGLWIDEFARRGIPIVDGAAPDDVNALARMRALFSQFETVTTNGWGSHVAYALAFGARVSIDGTEVLCSKEGMLRDATWAADPKVLETARAPAMRERILDFTRPFRVAPGDAVADPALGRWLIGADRRLSPAEMGALLARVTAASDLVAPDSMAALVAERGRVRAQAADFAAAGGGEKAAALLLSYLRRVVDARNARFLCETLEWVAGDLAAVDPEKARLVKAQADKLATRIAGPCP